jgi:hypothetical protein
MLIPTALLTGCALFSSGEIEKTCEDLPPGCEGVAADDTGLTQVDTADSGDTGGDCDDPSTWYADGDGDGYGDPDSATSSCEAPAQHVAESGDCDDSDRGVYPGAEEVWYDGVDQDCAGDDDYDADGDGYPGVEGGSSGAALDCEDGDDAVHPEQQEICGDGVDTNCDGSSNGCAHSGVSSVYDVAAATYGSSDTRHLGELARWVGDVDGDGKSDALIGADSEYDSALPGYGFVYLLTDVAAGGDLEEVAAQRIYNPELTYSWLGASAAGVGDVDGDGVGDLLIGAPYWTDYDSSAYYLGRVYLMSGADRGELSLDGALAVLEGDVAYNQAGLEVAGLGDINGDGLGELVIAEPGARNYAGRVAVIDGEEAAEGSTVIGAATLLLYGESSGPQYGGQALSVGDMDGDGLMELAVGATNPYGQAQGAAYVVSAAELGSGSVSLDGVGLVISSDSAYSTGQDVCLEGDLDGDGYDDLAVGVMRTDVRADQGGSVVIYYGPASGELGLGEGDAEIHGDTDDLLLGGALSMGDSDGDGRADLAMGAPQATSAGVEIGAVFLALGPVSGALSASDLSARFTGDDRGDYVGYEISLAGDGDGDGYDDLLVGALGDGDVYLIPGKGW